MNDDDYWIGRLKHTGQTLLYDHKSNSPSSSTVTFFIKEKHAIRSFDRQTVRRQVEPVADPIIKELTISAYVRWQLAQKRQALKKETAESTEIRQPHCYCGEKLYASAHKTCERCNWLICSQNHCGCTIEWDKPEK